MSHGDFLFRFRGPALNVHGNKAAGIFGEIFGSVVALSDGGNLELEFDEFGIEKAEENVVSALAIDGGELEILVVKALLDAGFGGLFAHLLYSSAARFTSSRVGCLGPSRLGTSIWVRPRFRPGDATGLILAEFIDAEVRADASNAGIGENFAKLRARIFGEASEARIVVANGRAEFHGLKSSRESCLWCRENPWRSFCGRARSGNRWGGREDWREAAARRGKKGCCDGGRDGFLRNVLREMADMAAP